jgi:hypothetical protein
MSTLTKIVALAKKLKKQAPNKFAKWTDYIKEASAKVKPVVKKAKKVAKKVTKQVKKTYKKHLGETHTDTNSHNVKLSIYSGTGLRKNENTLSYAKKKTTSINGVNELEKAIKQYNEIEKAIQFNKNVLINNNMSPLAKKLNRVMLAKNKKSLALMRKYIINIKKVI